MLISLKEMMAIAEERKIAIGAFNATGLGALEAEIKAAEELNLPIIIQFAEVHEAWIPLDVIGPIVIDMAKKTKVPVCANIDHGTDIPYIEKGLKLGFTGVMFDGSTLAYEKNVEMTKEVVALAKKYGASVEAELGSMGKTQEGISDCGAGNDDSTKIYTDPDLASDFVAKTKIDALACSFGTTHGIYLKEPKLDFDVVRNVRSKTNNIPIVMHGGSGVSMEDYKKAIEAGVRKINYFTYMDKAGGSGAVEYIKSLKEGEPIFFSSIYRAARDKMKENILEAMKTFARL